MNKRVAVITPVFNRRGLIIGTLDCLRKQSLPPHRVIVIDDCSDDNPIPLIEAWTQKHSLPFEVITIKNENNEGAAESRNRGLAYTDDCQFVYFLDSDDRPPETFLEKTVATISANNNMVAVSCDRLLCKENATELMYLPLISKNPWYWFMVAGAGVASCSLFRTDTVKRLGGFTHTQPTGHDTHLFMQIANMGEWGYIANCPVKYLSSKLFPHLCQSYDDFPRRWALIYETCLDNFGARNHIEPKVYRAELASVWFIAGVSLIRHKKFRTASRCLRRSLVWKWRNNWALYILLAIPLLKIYTPSRSNTEKTKTVVRNMIGQLRGGGGLDLPES